MKRVIGYSTGKDSAALVLWAKERFDPSEIIITFDDTIWEHELTYGYLAQMREGDLLRGLRFEKLVSDVYPGGLGALVQIKGQRFCTGFDEKSGKPFPWADDVFNYIEKTDADQLPMFEARSCMSVYNLCER